MDMQALQLHPDFGGVVIEESQHIVFAGVVTVDGALGDDTGVACAEDDDVFAGADRIHRFQIIHLESKSVYQQ